MSYAAFEQLALMLFVTASAIYATKVLAPDLWREMKKRALIAALKPERPALVRRFARRFAPAPRVRIPASACNTCNGCEKGRR